MCRVLYAPASAAKKIGGKLLEQAFAQLENSQGGHGNGAARPHKAIRGLNVDVADCAKFLSSAKAPGIFHTRLCSVGTVRDELCHPFPVRGRHTGHLIHNGHWAAGALAASVLQGHWSDTRVGARYVGVYGWEAFVKQRPTGAWLLLQSDGKLLTYDSDNRLVTCRETGIVTSEPIKAFGKWPETFDWAWINQKGSKWITSKALSSGSC